MDLDKLAKPFLRDIRPYKPGKPIEQHRRERGDDAPVAKLASNENPYPPIDAIQRAVSEAMNEANRYPESGAPELTARLAAMHAVGVEEVFVAHGTNEILDLMIRAYVNHDESVVFSALSFVIYKLICQQCGVIGVEVPCRDYKHDLAAMAEAIDARTKLVFVCNPNNPTATYNTAGELEEFLARVPEHVLVVLDEAYYEFVDAPDYPDSFALRRDQENIVILRTFSKFYSLAGLRVGWGVADARVVDILHKVRQPFNVNRLAQAAALVALEHRDELRRGAEEAIREREMIRETVIEAGCICPESQTNFLFVVPPKVPGDICRMLEDRGVIVRSMAPFGAPENAFRVNTGTAEENRRFVAAFREILGR